MKKTIVLVIYLILNMCFIASFLLAVIVWPRMWTGVIVFGWLIVVFTSLMLSNKVMLGKEEDEEGIAR